MQSIEILSYRVFFASSTIHYTSGLNYELVSEPRMLIYGSPDALNEGWEWASRAPHSTVCGTNT